MNNASQYYQYIPADQDNRPDITDPKGLCLWYAQRFDEEIDKAERRLEAIINSVGDSLSLAEAQEAREEALEALAGLAEELRGEVPSHD